MNYDWDEIKRDINLSKHGIDFFAATSVFEDTERIETIDDRIDYGEERVQVIGMARPGLLFVVYTERDKGDTYRIISARRANKREKALYNSMLGI